MAKSKIVKNSQLYLSYILRLLRYFSNGKGKVVIEVVPFKSHEKT